MRPDASEYAQYFDTYVRNVPEDDVCAAMAAQMEETRKLLQSVPEERGSYRYEPGKWSIKEVVGHLNDAERVFAYRAMAIARGEKQSLPGFDEAVYVQNANFERNSMQQLIDAYVAVRNASLALFRPLDAQAWQRRGTANNNPISVAALAYIALGHERHHLRILGERYLK